MVSRRSLFHEVGGSSHTRPRQTLISAWLKPGAMQVVAISSARRGPAAPLGAAMRVGFPPLLCRRNYLGTRNFTQQLFRPRRRVDNNQLHCSSSGIHGRMINVLRYINTRAGTDFYGRFIVDHLFALSGHHVDNFFRTRVVMSGVPFSLGQFDDTETEAIRIGNRRLAKKVDFSPVKFYAIDIMGGGNNAGAKFLHNGGKAFFFISPKIAADQGFCELGEHRKSGETVRQPRHTAGPEKLKRRTVSLALDRSTPGGNGRETRQL